MAYNYLTDFLALIRDASGQASLGQIPGLDYILSAMARAGFFRLSVGQNAPTTNQTTTVWLRPAQPSWTAEGTVFLWDASTEAYAVATPELWNNLLAPAGYVFQSADQVANIVHAGVLLVAIERVAPATTVLVLPTLLGQWRSGRLLSIADWSTEVVNHEITLTPSDGSTIMRQPSFRLFSSEFQLAGATLRPAPDLNGWIIAP